MDAVLGLVRRCDWTERITASHKLVVFGMLILPTLRWATCSNSVRQTPVFRKVVDHQVGLIFTAHVDDVIVRGPKKERG